MAQYVASELRSTNPSKFGAVDPNHIFIGEGENKKTLVQALNDAGSGNGILIVDTLDELNAITNLPEGTMAYVKTEENNYQYLPTEQGSETLEWTTFTSDLKAPKIIPITKKDGSTIYYNTLGTVMPLVFKYTSSAQGACKLRVAKDGKTIFERQMNSNPYTYELLENEMGTYKYDFSVISGNNVLSQSVSYTVISGGLNLSSTFDESATFINGVEGEANSQIRIPYSVNTQYGIEYINLTVSLTDLSGSVVSGYPKTLNNSNGLIAGVQDFLIGELPVGNYIVKLKAVCDKPADVDNEAIHIESNELLYKFSVISDKVISIIETLSTKEFTNNDFINIPISINMYKSNYFSSEVIIYKNSISDDNIINTLNLKLSKGKNTISIGRLNCTEAENRVKYIVVINASDYDTNQVSSQLQIELSIIYSAYQRVEHTTEGLIGYYTAESYTNNGLLDSDKGKWKNEIKTIPQDIPLPDINLYNFNYNTNGWMSENGTKYLKFDGETYGILNDNMFADISSNSRFSNGFTIDILFKTRCVGDFNARVLSTKADITDSVGFEINYNKASIRSSLSNISIGFNEDEWTKVTYVIPRPKSTDSQYDNVMLIYVNGVISSAEYITLNDNFGIDGCKLTLNSYQSNGKFTSFGNCEIKNLRIYKKALSKDEILNNMLADIDDLSEQSDKSDQNNSANILNYMGKLEITSIDTEPYCNDNNIEIPDGEPKAYYYLTTVNDKNTLIKVNAKFTPKNGLDRVKEWTWIDEGDGVLKNGIQLSLQGTSSLNYPVKNFRLYMPGNKTDDVTDDLDESERTYSPFDGWIEEKIFTLKCDFMDSSHMNNVGSAKFIDNACNEMGIQSPAQKANPTAGYRNTIDGYPVLLVVDGHDIGTFMFNVDKNAYSTFGFKEENPVLPANATNHVLSYEITANASSSAGAFVPWDVAKDKILSNPETTIHNEFEYYKDSFEIRYTDGDEEDIQDNTSLSEDERLKAFESIKTLVEWVYNSDDDTFKSEFEQHFDKKYILFYFLQVMTFGMVDNFGKNCMLDSWNAGDNTDDVKAIWYPRFYDMDTMAGLNNQGYDKIPTDLELEKDGVEIEDSKRRCAFNTISVLWKRVYKLFEKDLKNMYTTLRQKVYNIPTIKKYFIEPISDTIGEYYYNLNAENKYIKKILKDSFIYCANGNRKTRFIEWITERINFMDTLMDYTEGSATNTKCTFRFNTISDYKLILNTYSPLYITCSFKNGATKKVFCHPNSKYSYTENGTTISGDGALLAFTTDASNQEVSINCANFLMSIGNLKTANPDSIKVETATRLTSFDISNTTEVTDLSLGTKKYLKYLDISNCINLISSIKLGECPNLRTFKCKNSPISGVEFATGSSLRSIDISNTNINSLKLLSMELLEDLNISNCNSISVMEIEGCNNLNKFNISSLPVSTLSITNCNGLTSLGITECKSLNTLTIQYCDKLLELVLTGSKLAANALGDIELDISTLYSLERLVTETTNIEYIIFPKFKNQLEASKGENGEKWSTLRKLNLKESDIKSFKFGSIGSSYEDGTLDFTQLTHMTGLYMPSCYNITKINNINILKDNLRDETYSGVTEVGTDGKELTSFRVTLCTNLTYISGNVYMNEYATTSKSNCISIFQICKKLTNIDNLTLDLKAARNISYIASQSGLNSDSINKILNSCSTELKNMTGAFYMCTNVSTITTSMFSEITNVENMDSAFHGCKLTSLPNGLFNGLTKLSTMEDTFRSNPIHSIPYNLFENCTSLTNISKLFLECGKNEGEQYSEIGEFKIVNGDNNNALLDFINSLPSGIESMILTFAKTTVSIDSLDGIFDHLINIKNLDGLFYNCFNIIHTGTLPEGLFANNNKLESATMLFAQNAKPGSNSSNENLNKICLKNASLPNNLFIKNGVTIGCPELTDISGMFYNSGIQGEVKSDIFKGASIISKLQEASLTADHGQTVVKYECGGVFEGTNITGFYGDFLYPLGTNLISISRLFKDCTNLNIVYKRDNIDSENSTYTKLLSDHFIEDILYKSDGLILADSIFNGCTKLSGTLSSKFFEKCKKISSVSYAFKSTALNSIDSASSLFKNNKELLNASYLFSKTNLVVIPDNILSNEKNPNIKKIDGMFSECASLNTIPSGLFNGLNKLESAKELFKNCTGYTSKIPNALLKNCDNLLYVNSLFYGCSSLTGGYTNTSLGDGTYISNTDLLEGSGNVKDISNIFYKCSNLNGSIHPNLFKTNTNIENANNAFYHCPKITGTLDYNFLSNCNKIVTVNSMFYQSGIQGFEFTTDSNNKEVFFLSHLNKHQSNTSNVIKSIKDMSKAFGYCSSLSGKVPTYWSKTNSGVDTGYNFGTVSGIFVNCSSTAVTNYADIQTNCLTATI